MLQTTTTIPFQKRLYEIIRLDYAIFNFIQKYTAEGLLIWEPTEPNQIQLDENLCKTLGCNDEKVKLIDILHENDLTSFQRNIQKQLKEEGESEFKLRFRGLGESILICRTTYYLKENKKVFKIIVAFRSLKSNKDKSEERGNLKRNIEIESFINDSTGTTALLDNNMQILAASSSWLKKFNTREKNIVGGNFYKLFPDVPEERKEIHKKCLLGETITGTENLFTLKDGSQKWLNWAIRPWFKSNEEIGGIIMEVSDISRLKKLEQLHWEREVFLNAILETIDVGIISCDKSGKPTLFNKATKEWHGLPATDIPMENLSDYYGLYKIDGVTPLEIDEIPLLKALKNGSVKNDEILIKPKIGKNKILSVSGSQLLDDNHNVIGAVVAMNDITELKKVEEKIKYSETIFRHTFYNAAAGMVMVDMNGDWVRYNDRFLELTGYTAAEVENLHFNDFAHPEEREDNLLLFMQCIEGKIKYYSSEKRTIHKDGHYVPVIISGSILYDDKDQPLYSVTQIIDITVQKNAEKELKESLDNVESLLLLTNGQNERLKNFAHIVSHNLRSHSGNLSMLIDLYIQENPTVAQDELIVHLKTASQNLQETLIHLNEVVLMNTALNTNLKNLNLYDYIELAKENVSGLAKNKDVKIENNVPKDIQIQGVPAYLDSIVLNFLTNGIKYRSPKRNSYIKLNIENSEEHLILKIEDNGLGIDLDKNRNKLFGMYKTFHNNKDSRGIGLFITKNQVEGMGGKIEVESEINKGTIFKIYFKYEKN